MIKSKSGMIKNIVLLVLLVLVIVSNFFSSQMEILLKLKPNITNSFETQVHFIDVGQGDAIAIRFSNGKTMLIDSGTKEYKHKLQYYLDNVVLDNTKTLDYVLLTHPDVDHSGNMEFILNNYNVKEFFRPEIYEVFENKTPYCENLTYRQIIQTLNKLEIPTKFSSEQSLSSDGININILSVLGTYHDLGRIETNEFSPTIIIEDNNTKILLAGDTSSETEDKLLRKYPSEMLDVDILKLSHHGSKYSNSYEFLEVTSPKIAVACCGVNTYGHPANDTVQRLLEYDKNNEKDLFSNYYTTLDDGNIVITFDNNTTVDIIKNIDAYNFADYYIYTIIVSVFIIYIIILPQIKVWKKDIRFVLQNKRFEKYKLKESKNIETNSNKF
ncbi:MAG TPA: hypothetical protein DD614_02940 [Clostridiales bacterium]|nr:hypothetical protein [Clostridiales bacterium]